MCGKADNGQTVSVNLFAGTNGGNQVITVHLRHLNVGDQQVERLACQDVKCCLAVIGNHAGMSPRLEQAHQDDLIYTVVLHHQNVEFGGAVAHGLLKAG